MEVIFCGCEILIDEDDYLRLKNYVWCLKKKEAEKTGRFYFARYKTVNGKRIMLTLHRDIIGCYYGDGKIVDHKNGNTLDNRKENLRVCTVTENNRNSKKGKNNKSGSKGVYWYKRYCKWHSRIMVDRKFIHLGYFLDKKEAAKAYADASKKYHGEFGRTE